MIIKDVLCPKTIQKMFIVMFNHLFDLTDHMVGVSWYNEQVPSLLIGVRSLD